MIPSGMISNTSLLSVYKSETKERVIPSDHTDSVFTETVCPCISNKSDRSLNLIYANRLGPSTSTKQLSTSNFASEVLAIAYILSCPLTSSGITKRYSVVSQPTNIRSSSMQEKTTFREMFSDRLNCNEIY